MARARRRTRLFLRGDRFHLLRQAEVEDLDVAVLRDEEVLGLQVPVNDALLVRGGKTLRDLERVIDGLLLRNRTCVELAPQRLAFPELHHGVRNAFLIPEVEDRENVRMRKCRDRLRLTLEPSERIRVRRKQLGENLDRNVAVQLPIPRPVDLPHPARPERREDLVGTETSSGCERHQVGALYTGDRERKRGEEWLPT